MRLGPQKNKQTNKQANFMSLCYFAVSVCMETLDVMTEHALMTVSGDKSEKLISPRLKKNYVLKLHLPSAFF